MAGNVRRPEVTLIAQRVDTDSFSIFGKNNIRFAGSVTLFAGSYDVFPVTPAVSPLNECFIVRRTWAVTSTVAGKLTEAVREYTSRVIVTVTPVVMGPGFAVVKEHPLTTSTVRATIKSFQRLIADTLTIRGNNLMKVFHIIK